MFWDGLCPTYLFELEFLELQNIQNCVTAKGGDTEQNLQLLRLISIDGKFKRNAHDFHDNLHDHIRCAIDINPYDHPL